MAEDTGGSCIGVNNIQRPGIQERMVGGMMPIISASSPSSLEQTEPLPACHHNFLVA